MNIVICFVYGFCDGSACIAIEHRRYVSVEGHFVMCPPDNAWNWFSSKCFCVVLFWSSTLHEHAKEHSPDGLGESTTAHLWNCLSHQHVAYAGVANYKWGRYVFLSSPEGWTFWTKSLCSMYGFLPLSFTWFSINISLKFYMWSCGNPHETKVIK
jgi:hypothetical protein